MKTAAPAGRTPPPEGWLRIAPWIFLLLWSSGFVVLKVGLRDADPLTFLALRYACALALLLPACLWVRPRFPATRAGWVHLAVVGLLVQAGYFSFTYLALKAGASPGVVALVTSQQPLLVGLLAPAVAGERVPPLQWAGLVLGVAGAATVIVARSGLDLASPWALVLAGLALLSMSAGTLWEKRFGAAVHPLAANLVQYAVALAVTGPLAWALEPLQVHWSPSLLAALAYLVLANSIIAITLLLAMVRHGEAARVSALFFLVPPATAVAAFAFLDETIPPLAWPGMLLAAAGLYLVTRAP